MSGVMSLEDGTFWTMVGGEAAQAIRGLAGRRTYERGQALMHAGQVPDDVLVLRAGHVKISAVTPAGRLVLLGFRGPGDLVGELAAIDDRPRSASIVALEPIEALVLTRAQFHAVIARHPPVAFALLRVLSDRLRDADAKRAQFAGHAAMGRVAFCLLELCDRFGVADADAIDIRLPISQEELAGWAGASLESVSRSLQTMRGLGWIETRRRAIRVLERDALRSATA
jgi:CRP/FNR family transcriptional regulator, cyclic AMP receptor protein